MIVDERLRNRIDRVRRTYSGLARSYSKSLTVQEKLQGVSKSIGKNKGIVLNQ
jgi:hypothetical protein